MGAQVSLDRNELKYLLFLFSTPRIIPKWERVYCWLLIVLGIAGGCLATVQALLNIFSASMSAPCYLMDDPSNITIAGGGH